MQILSLSIETEIVYWKIFTRRMKVFISFLKANFSH